MESLQHIKAHVKGVKNISQITKAMEVVAATKMRVAQERALTSRPYALKVLEILATLLRHGTVAHPLTRSSAVEQTLLVMVASDRGLAGSFNAQVFRAMDDFLRQDAVSQVPDHRYSMVAVGKKAAQYATKKQLPIIERFAGFGDFIEVEEVEPLSNVAIQGFIERTWQRVIVISTHFRTALRQEVIVRQLLPADLNLIQQTVDEIVPEYGRFASLSAAVVYRPSREEESDYIFEPNPQRTIELLLPYLIRMQLYHLVLEANASEHSARRVAMKNASDNAQELSTDLTLSYNKARQAGITNQIIEIVSTQSALTQTS